MRTGLASVRRLLAAAGMALVLAVPVAGSASAEAPANHAELEQQVVALVNAERVSAGLAPLVANRALGAVAQGYADELALGGCFSHACGPVPQLTDRVGLGGYADWVAIGENIAAGQPTPEAVVAGWMNSPGHRANVLSPDFLEIGVGVSNGAAPYRIFWAQNFGARANGVVEVAAAPAFQELPLEPAEETPAEEAPAEEAPEPEWVEWVEEAPVE